MLNRQAVIISVPLRYQKFQTPKRHPGDKLRNTTTVITWPIPLRTVILHIFSYT
jgi:hypothetical protein